MVWISRYIFWPYVSRFTRICLVFVHLKHFISLGWPLCLWCRHWAKVERPATEGATNRPRNGHGAERRRKPRIEKLSNIVALLYIWRDQGKNNSFMDCDSDCIQIFLVTKDVHRLIWCNKTGFSLMVKGRNHDLRSWHKWLTLIWIILTLVSAI